MRNLLTEETGANDLDTHFVTHILSFGMDTLSGIVVLCFGVYLRQRSARYRAIENDCAQLNNKMADTRERLARVEGHLGLA